MSEAASALPESASALPPGTRLGEFEVKSLLGVGGFGIVYLAFDHQLEREVAIKEYMPASMAGRTATMHVSLRSQGDAEVFALGQRSFVNEAKLLARFDHPSLIKVHRFWQANGTAYMAMPVLRGRTLKDIRRSTNRAPDEAWLRSLLTPLLGALEQLHNEGVYHRDISPDNIHLETEGRPVLLDFGAARRVITGKTQTLTAILKPAYAPIEQYAETGAVKQGPWTDLYALGATLHFMLLGYPPAPATARAVADESSALTPRTAPGISANLLAAIEWMLAPRPTDRPQSVGALRAVLEGRAALPHRPGAAAPATEAWEQTAIVPPLGAQPPAAPFGGGLRSELEIDLTQPPPTPQRRAGGESATHGRASRRALPDTLSVAADDAHRLPPPPARSRLVPLTLGAALVVAALGYFGWSRFLAPGSMGAVSGAASAPAAIGGAATSPAAAGSPPANATAAVPTTPTTPTTPTITTTSEPATPNAGAAAAGGASTDASPGTPAGSPPDAPAATLPANAPTGAPLSGGATPSTPGAVHSDVRPLPRPIRAPNAPARSPPAGGTEPGPFATPEGICAGRSPLSNFLCMERECLRPRFRGHAECQAWRQRARPREGAGG